MQSLFAARVKSRRLELDMTQEELAVEVGVSPPNISQFESDVRKPSYDTMLKLSRALGVGTDYLIGTRELGFEDLLADSRISEMMDGFLTLPEKQKSQLCRMYQGLAALCEKEKNERDASAGQ